MAQSVVTHYEWLQTFPFTMFEWYPKHGTPYYYIGSNSYFSFETDLNLLLEDDRTFRISVGSRSNIYFHCPCARVETIKLFWYGTLPIPEGYFLGWNNIFVLKNLFVMQLLGQLAQRTKSIPKIFLAQNFRFFGTFYCSRSGVSVVGYVDANFAGDLDSRRSTTTYVFTLARGLICWRSVIQSVVALSMIKVEYIMIVMATKEVFGLQD